MLPVYSSNLVPGTCKCAISPRRFGSAHDGRHSVGGGQHAECEPQTIRHDFCSIVNHLSAAVWPPCGSARAALPARRLQGAAALCVSAQWCN